MPYMLTFAINIPQALAFGYHTWILWVLSHIIAYYPILNPYYPIKPYYPILNPAPSEPARGTPWPPWVVSGRPLSAPPAPSVPRRNFHRGGDMRKLGIDQAWQPGKHQVKLWNNRQVFHGFVNHQW